MYKETYYCNEINQTIKYFDLKHYEDNIKIHIDTQWFKEAVIKVVESYLSSFSYDEDEGYEEYKKIKSSISRLLEFGPEYIESFPYTSCFSSDSQISKDVIEFMKNKIKNESLTKYHLEWYFLANGCYQVNKYITLPLMKALYPNKIWYFCKTDYHCFVTNTNNFLDFKDIPEKIAITKLVDHPILVVDLINYQIGMNLDYLTGLKESDCIFE